LAFLDMLDPDDRAALLRAGRPQRYRAGTPIILQGDRSDTLFVIRSGSVKVTLATFDGHEILLTVLGPGEVFGEFEAIDRNGGPRDASVVALEPVDCRVFTPDELQDYLMSHPRVAYELLRTLIQRLRAADRRRTDSGSADVGHRLARFLLELADERGRPGPGGIDIELPVTQGELASQIAASRESAVRALTRLRAQGLISTGRRRITIRDADGLRKYADVD
jgi:CRP-like cAMP-binding protein